MLKKNNFYFQFIKLYKLKCKLSCLLFIYNLTFEDTFWFISPLQKQKTKNGKCTIHVLNELQNFLRCLIRFFVRRGVVRLFFWILVKTRSSRGLETSGRPERWRSWIELVSSKRLTKRWTHETDIRNWNFCTSFNLFFFSFF